jgi:methyl-accepting chemotaxis protein
MKTLKQLFSNALALTVGACLLLVYSVYRVGTANAELTAAHEARYQSTSLAGELRQSSDDLTRLARTYVVSADPMWEQQYFEVLDIRNGKKPRPPGYEKIYWDFQAAGMAPSGPAHEGKSTSESLQDRMKVAGFTAEEFAKLKEAANNSDGLVKTETVAMNLVKGQYADGQGGFTKKGEPDLANARAMMHDASYHRYKAQIMKPVDEFLQMLDQRTAMQVAASTAMRDRWYVSALACIALLAACASGSLLYVQTWIKARLGAEPGTLVDSVNSLAQGNLAVRLVNESNSSDSVMGALDQMASSFSRSVAQVRSTADSVATASGQIAQGNQDLSDRTEQQASALQQTAGTMEQLGSTVRNNADSAEQANQLAQGASAVAVQGGEVVGKVVATMQGITESSRKIGDIISVIDGIAFQTNILALNAAVEAARAGEQGRGFAVVASEVRNLAQRSAEAAKEIKTLIGRSVDQVEQGTALVDQAGRTMGEIVDSIRRVSDIVAEITSASAAQSAGVQQVGEAVSQMDRATQQNAALVEQSAAAAESLRDQAQQLVHAVAVFSLPQAAHQLA